SYALVADALESTLDIFSSLIVWGGLRISSRSADEAFPFGYGKAESLATVVVGFLLLGGAVGIAVEAVREILTPHHAPAPFTLAVVFIKEILFRRVFAVGREVESAAVQADAWHHRSDAITSGAAAVGIAIALIGGPGWEEADDWAHPRRGHGGAGGAGGRDAESPAVRPRAVCRHPCRGRPGDAAARGAHR